MPENKIGNIPEMDGVPHKVQPVPESDDVEEVEEETPEETPAEKPEGEEETPASPKPSDADKPSEESEEPEEATEEAPEEEAPEEKSTDKPADETPEEDEEAKKRQLQGLENEEKSLDGDLTDLDTKITETKQRIVDKRKERRDKRDESKDDSSGDTGDVITKSDDDLSDLDPTYVKDIKRVLTSQGYVTKGELSKTTYEDAVKISKTAFFKAHPHFDPSTYDGSKNWEKMQEELKLYARPDDPSQLAVILEKARVAVEGPGPKPKKVNPAIIAAQNKKIRLQGAGGTGKGGSATPAQPKTSKLSDEQKEHYRRGGWSEEDIADLDS